MEHLDKLKELAELRSSGALTDEEFEEQKALLLATSKEPDQFWVFFRKFMIYVGIPTVLIYVGVFVWFFAGKEERENKEAHAVLVEQCKGVKAVRDLQLGAVKATTSMELCDETCQRMACTQLCDQGTEWACSRAIRKSRTAPLQKEFEHSGK